MKKVVSLAVVVGLVVVGFSGVANAQTTTIEGKVTSFGAVKGKLVTFTVSLGVGENAQVPLPTDANKILILRQACLGGQANLVLDGVTVPIDSFGCRLFEPGLAVSTSLDCVRFGTNPTASCIVSAIEANK